MSLGIQFTPDLMPSDITGTEVLHEDRGTGERQLKYMPGPIFSNIVLADEINRTPPKTQAALLEAMQERQVTSGGNRHALPDPFFVLATQNPIEQEGTYPLPERSSTGFSSRSSSVIPPATKSGRFIAARRDWTAKNRRKSWMAARFQDCSRWCGGSPFPTTASITPWRLVRATRPPNPTTGSPPM